MNVKALIVGLEVLFNGPHGDQSVAEDQISQVHSLMELEGFNVDPGRLSYLFNMHLEARRRRIDENRIETSMESVVEKVLNDLEIDHPPMISRLAGEIAENRMPLFSPAVGSLDFLDRMKGAKVKLGVVCNSPLGIAPSFLMNAMEAAGIYEYLEDAQFSSENGVVRPHARPFRYAVSNMDVKPDETAVLTGMPAEMGVLHRLGFKSVFIPEQAGDGEDAVGIQELSELSRYV